MYACAADDEKVLRILAGPRTFVQSLANISGVAADETQLAASMPAGASLPALGLSNKPTYDSASAAAAAAPGDTLQQQQQLLLAAAAAGGDDDEDDGGVVDDGAGQLQPTVMTSPPLEDALSQITLWPELRKLYGHNNATFAMAASGDGRLLASGCRAQTAAVAVLRLWDTNTWAEVQALQGHTLTVTGITFTCGDNCIVSVSRDRSLCVYARPQPGEDFSLVTRIEKAHDRVANAIVAHPSPPPSFASVVITGGRDKKIKFWDVRGQPDCMLQQVRARFILFTFPLFLLWERVSVGCCLTNQSQKGYCLTSLLSRRWRYLHLWVRWLGLALAAA
jgi:elongator complex protein 2